MIDALVAGKVYGDPRRGTGKTGNSFVTAKVKVSAGNGETLLCSVIAFDERVQTALLALGEGDSVSLSGSLTPKVYLSKDGEHRPALDLVAHAVMTPYHVTRKRRAMLGNVES